MSQQLQSSTSRSTTTDSPGSPTSEPEPPSSGASSTTTGSNHASLTDAAVTVPHSPASLWASTSRPISVIHSVGAVTDPAGWIEATTIVACD